MEKARNPVLNLSITLSREYFQLDVVNFRQEGRYCLGKHN